MDNNDILSRYLTDNRCCLLHVEMGDNQVKPAADAERKPDWLEMVRRQVGSLRYGVVQIVVHDSQVTQIDKTERVRLEKLRAEAN